VPRLTATLAAVTLIVTLAVPAAASTPTNETIVLLRDSQSQEIGWSASGTFTDAGSWTSDFRRSGALPSPVAFETMLKTTETSSFGTFRLEFQGHFNAPAGHDFGGTWVLSGGTGAYVGIHGVGTWSVAPDPGTGGARFTLVGAVQFD
jgi:hypothetical protein